MKTICVISFIGACILYYMFPEVHYYLVLALCSIVFFLCYRYEEKDQYLLNKLMVKIQYETNIYDSPRLIKKVCLKASKADYQFYDKTPYKSDKNPYYIDDKSLYKALRQTIIQMQRKRNKWYVRYYSKNYWENLERLLIVFHR
jgi:hypothetical protein